VLKKSSTKVWALIAMICVVFLTLFWFKRGSEAKLDVYAKLQKIDHFDLNQIKGNYFILHFWAKWCEPCAEEIPHLVEFARQAQFEKPLKILAVSLDPSLEESKKILPNQGADLPPNFILLLDAEHKFAESMGSYQYPETYLVDPSGQVIEKWVGPQKWNKPEVLEFFRQKVL
jgi:thiol-disulfide isomerase/thioredoxin